MRLKIFLLILSFSLMLSAQNTSIIKQKTQSIQSQPEKYYFGFAEGRERKTTDQKALENLMSSIYVVVSSEMTYSTSENAEGRIDDNLEKKLNSYTYGRLPNVHQLVYKTGPIFHILRYLPKDDYQKIFDNKKIEICGFLREAEENLELNQLGKAFRNYYRAAVAIEALPKGNIVYNKKNYSPEKIFDKIRHIAEKIEIEVVSNKYEYQTRYIVLDFSYQEKHIYDLNIEYYDLHDYIPQKTNSNLLQLELYGEEYEEFPELLLKIDLKEELYNSYSEQTKIMERLFECEELEEYREIPLKMKKVEKVKSENYEISELNIELENKANCLVLDKFAQNLIKLFSMLEYEYVDDETIFSDSKIVKRMKNVIDYNHTKLLDYPQKVQINKTDVGWEARQFGVSVSCVGAPSRNETVVIDFDNEGKIYNFCYTINSSLHQLFQEQGIAAGDWDYRQIAIKFLENYKTSYTTKNIDDVETLYSEDAIIITGKVVKRTKVDQELETDFSKEEIIYFKKTKKEHIASQKKVFEDNKFVWLQFDTFNINIAPIDSIYGVSMKQNYYSSTYQDEGYLFLLIDFRGADPLIHVRNWQPDEWNLSKQMKLENFRFY